MNIADELIKLQRLHDEGVLNEAEFAQAKAKLLADSGNEQALQQKLANVERQQRALQIDQEWQIERENYLVRGQRGRYLPTKERAILSIMTAVFVSSILVFVSPERNGSSLLGLTFLVLLLMGSWSAYIFYKANAYSQAEAEYQVRRKQVERDDS